MSESSGDWWPSAYWVCPICGERERLMLTFQAAFTAREWVDVETGDLSGGDYCDAVAWDEAPMCFCQACDDVTGKAVWHEEEEAGE